MITINDITRQMSYFEQFLHPCKGCGVNPRFLYCDTCTPESIIRIEHKCTTKQCNKMGSRINLITLYTYKDLIYFVNTLLSQMVEEWNTANN